MSKLNDIAFLGVCSQVDEAAQPFPYGAVNLFQLSHYKPHFVFPPIIKGDRWVFIIWGEDLTKENLEALEVRVIDEEGNLFTKAKMTLLDDEEDSSKKIEIKGDSTDNNSGLRIGRELNDASEVRRETTICITKENRPVLFSFTTDSLMAKPGKYKVFVKYKGREGELGFVEYVYSPASPLTADKIRAIESNPSAKKIIHYELGCKFCDSKMRIYSAIERDKKLEASGYIYQTEVKDDFHCGCGRTNTPTMYIKESLHGFLYVDYEMLKLDYVRRYAHSNIVNIANIFTSLLDDEHEEERYQKFIESNLVLLAKFYAKSIFFKPTIIGKYKTDFVILTATKELLLIEIEPPSIEIFKKSGHVQHKVHHAYNQVNDWLFEYNKHPQAVLDVLGIKPEEVNCVKGVVILGRSTAENSEHLRKHLSNPPYKNIDFLTYDDLVQSMLEISKQLA